MQPTETLESLTRFERNALRFNACGQRLQEEGRLDRALRAYQRASELAPNWSIPWYNMGLYHKYRGDWMASRTCSRRAVELNPEDEAAWWNLGIAATALGDWSEARRAWRGFGIALPPEEGPVSLPCGPTPIRINPAHAPEVVWCDRIDPARAIIRNVPLPQSGRRFGDLVLHDGAPNGYRKCRDSDVEQAVFDELALLQASSYFTIKAHIGGVAQTSLASLDRAFHDADDGCCELWSSTVQMLCKDCSEGRPYDGTCEHMQEADDEFYIVGIACMSEAAADRILDRWLQATPGATLMHLETVLQPPSPGAELV